MLSREISPKVICEKVEFSNCDFWNTFHDNEYTYIKLFKNIFYGVQTEGKGEINMAYYNYSKSGNPT